MIQLPNIAVNPKVGEYCMSKNVSRQMENMMLI